MDAMQSCKARMTQGRSSRRLRQQATLDTPDLLICGPLRATCEPLPELPADVDCRRLLAVRVSWTLIAYRLLEQLPNRSSPGAAPGSKETRPSRRPRVKLKRD
jgi:hypothetical protein